MTVNKFVHSIYTGIIYINTTFLLARAGSDWQSLSMCSPTLKTDIIISLTNYYKTGEGWVWREDADWGVCWQKAPELNVYIKKNQNLATTFNFCTS